MPNLKIRPHDKRNGGTAHRATPARLWQRNAGAAADPLILVWQARALLHVTNLLGKKRIWGQMCWRDCNKTNNFQCYQYEVLIRVLSE